MGSKPAVFSVGFFTAQFFQDVVHVGQGAAGVNFGIGLQQCRFACIHCTNPIALAVAQETTIAQPKLASVPMITVSL